MCIGTFYKNSGKRLVVCETEVRVRRMWGTRESWALGEKREREPEGWREQRDDHAMDTRAIGRLSGSFGVM